MVVDVAKAAAADYEIMAEDTVKMSKRMKSNCL